MRTSTESLASHPALFDLTRDPGVSRITAHDRRDPLSGRGAVAVELVHNGMVISVTPIEDADDFEALLARLLGPNRLCGAVTIQEFAGLAALPPVADHATLVLERLTPARSDAASGLPAPVIGLAARMLDAGAGIVLAGPHRARLVTALAAVTARLAPSTRVALLHDGMPTSLRRPVLRVREAPTDALAVLRGTTMIIDRAVPPPLPLLAGAVVFIVTARTPNAAVARMASGTTVLPSVLARLCADVAPLLLWTGDDDGAAPGLVYEILGRSAHPDGLPLLQALLVGDPASAVLVATGADPEDPTVRAAMTEMTGR